MDETVEPNQTPEELAKIEADERQRAEEQAAHDVETAKRLVAEKKQNDAGALKKHEDEKVAQAREEEKRQEKERAQHEQAETDRLAKEALALQKQEDEIAKTKAQKLALQKDKDLAHKQEKLAEEITRKKDAAKREAEKLEKEQPEREALQEKQRLEDEAKKALVKTQAPTPPKDTPETKPEPTKKPGFLQRISAGLRKSTSRMSDNVSAVFNKRKLDAEALEELEDLLIASDLGVGPAMRVTQLLAKDKFDKQITDMEIKIALADVIAATLAPLEKPIILTDTKPQIMLFVGVNGSGKTTTLGKLASKYTQQGKKVLLCAGDTFRAAAVEQLKIWGERANAPVVSAPLGADAAGLVYDAIAEAKEGGYDILMIDTAGRLQNRTELMDELSKIVRVIKKQDETAPHHCLLVLDATVGQNAILQTDAFEKTAGVTGLIMTKLDGTAKGGVLVALADKFKLPIHAIGIGEGIDDLETFSAPVFAAALSGIADAVIEEN
ncbi:MAG: signal recognition particle-docking protein FtsY [Robiginitomaculum sp.]|nr:MAG: signal recognition particle-docking protein FtsY [Robiginitomaculum sp.]